MPNRIVPREVDAQRERLRERGDRETPRQYPLLSDFLIAGIAEKDFVLWVSANYRGMLGNKTGSLEQVLKFGVRSASGLNPVSGARVGRTRIAYSVSMIDLAGP